jgi:hypothetical protein
MSILLLLVFLSILLFVGFGFNGWSLSAILLALTVGLSFLMTGLDIETIKSRWAENRCTLDILLTSFLYKPDTDARPTGEFVRENFDFCIRQSIQDVLKVLLTPLFAALGKEMEVAQGLTEAMNGLRTIKGGMMSSFQKLFDPIYQRFLHTGIAYSQGFQRMLSAMKRIGGIAIASLYLGMSLQVSIQNFVDFVIRVVMIMMGIIASLFIVLFFGLVPFLFILITTLAVLAEGGVDTGGLGSVFCFDPSTKVKLKDGTVKAIDRLSVGDTLENNAEVEGVLRTKALNEQLYSVHGILVSGSHLIWSEEEDEWIPVSEMENATPVFQRPPFLVCLRTSTRTIPLRDTYGTLHTFRDWEELPLNSPESDTLWNYLVAKLLQSKETAVPKEDPLCGPRCAVMLKTGEKTPISMVRIGDIVYSEEGFTPVLGIYEGEASLSTPSSLSDGIWIGTSSNWSHPSVGCNGSLQRGFHLVTQSGSLWIESENHSGFIRDFTEVGLENLPLTYSYTKALLKKSRSKEELCVPVSLSQAFLSYSQPIF